MKQIGNVAALPGIVHVSNCSGNLLFFCSHLPEIIAFQMGTLLGKEVCTKVLLKAVCVLGTFVWVRRACKGRLQKCVRKGSTHLLHCLSFDMKLFMLFQFSWATFPHCLYWPLVGFDLPVLWNTWRSVERAGGGTVVCIIVAGLMWVGSPPMHSTPLSLILCHFGSKASDRMTQEENAYLWLFSRSAKYNVEMTFLTFNIAYINK